MCFFWISTTPKAKSQPETVPENRRHQVLIRVSLSRAVADTLGLESMFPPHVEVTVPVWLNNVGMPLGVLPKGPTDLTWWCEPVRER